MKKKKLEEIISEEVLNILEASMSRRFMKAVEELQKIQLAQQQLRKKFVAEKDAKKKEKLKQDIIKMHKVVQKAELDFNSAIKAEPVDLDENILTERTAKDTLKDAVNALTKTFGGKKIDKRYVKDYLKSMERMARKKPMDFVKDYGDFKVADWIEDAQYNLQNEGKRNLTEDVFKAFLGDDPTFKMYTAHNTEKRKSVQARKTDRVWDDGVPVLKYIARAPKKPSPLPKDKFKIIEDNKYGWWYYQVGRTWYGIQQKDYGTPPFEY